MKVLVNTVNTVGVMGGNGELACDDVQPLMSHYLRALPITIFIYGYDGKPGKAEHHEIAEMRIALRRSRKLTL